MVKHAKANQHLKPFGRGTPERGSLAQDESLLLWRKSYSLQLCERTSLELKMDCERAVYFHGKATSTQCVSHSFDVCIYVDTVGLCVSHSRIKMLETEETLFFKYDITF